MIKKVLPVIVIVGFALFLASMMFWTSDVVVKSEMEDQQTIEQKIDANSGKLDVIIEILKKERETLKLPVFTDVNDKKAMEYRKQFQEEIK